MKEELAAQIAELQELHSGLTEIDERGHETAVSGELPFEASPDGRVAIADSFEIELLIPETYPKTLPRVRETGEKIDDDYDHVYEDGTFCLAVPIEERRIFCRQPCLLGFVNHLVVPYLYGYCYWKRYGEHPFGEQKHGGDGITQYYVERLELCSDVAALAVVAYLYEHGYRGHHGCPCGSGSIVRKCHGPMLRELHQHHTAETLRHDFRLALEHCVNKHGAEAITNVPQLERQVRRLIARYTRRT